MGSLRDETIAKLTGDKSNPEATVDNVKKQADDMSVIDKAMDTAKKLANTGALEAEMDRKDKKLEKAEQDRDKAIEGQHKAEIETVRTELGSKIDKLAQAYAGGASKNSIAEQIAEIKKAANELNMGGSRISEVREMMNLIATLNPQKTLVDQIKDAKELINTIMPPPGTGKEFSIGGMPATIALELKKMDTNLQITLENMKDERQRKDQEFQIKIKEYDEARADRIQEAAGKLEVERERNKMISGGLETVGRAIGKGLAEAGGQGSPLPGAIAGKAAEPPKSYHIELGQNEAADFNCPKCSTIIAVGPDSTQAQCVGCNSKFPVVRKPAIPVTGPPPPNEEE
jgi:hypothetical protein